jgi:ribosomal protein S27E
MNPIFSWVIAHTVAETLARRCPKCGRKQIVPKEKKNEAVPCQKCGETLPPKRR